MEIFIIITIITIIGVTYLFWLRYEEEESKKFNGGHLTNKEVRRLLSTINLGNVVEFKVSRDWDVTITMYVIKFKDDMILVLKRDNFFYENYNSFFYEVSSLRDSTFQIIKYGKCIAYGNDKSPAVEIINDFILDYEKNVLYKRRTDELNIVLQKVRGDFKCR